MEVFADLRFCWRSCCVFVFQHRSCTPKSILIDTCAPFSLLLLRQRIDAFAKVFKLAQISPLHIQRILQRYDILPPKFCITNQIPPHLRFHVQPLHRIPRVHIARIPHSYKMCIIREHLIGNRIHHFALVILEEVQLDQICGLKGLSIDRIGAVFGEPRQDIVDVEYCAIGRADRGFEGLEG